MFMQPCRELGRKPCCRLMPFVGAFFPRRGSLITRITSRFFTGEAHVFRLVLRGWLFQRFVDRPRPELLLNTGTSEALAEFRTCLSLITKRIPPGSHSHTSCSRPLQHFTRWYKDPCLLGSDRSREGRAFLG